MKNSNSALLVLATVTMVALIPSTQFAIAEELTGLEISRRADEVRRSDSEHSIMTMTLENHRGQTRVRTIDPFCG